jgi:CelD/BcsL family acetyltransferase involved in cellulose biosynthesis
LAAHNRESAISGAGVLASPNGHAGPRTLAAAGRESAGRPFEIDPLTDPRWGRLVDEHPQSSIFHTPQWLSALQNAYGYRPLVLTTSGPGSPLTNGIVFCEVNSWLTGRRLVSLPFADHCEPLLAQSSDSDLPLLHALGEVSRRRVKSVELRPVSWEPANATAFRRSDQFVLHRVDLRPPIETVYRGFHKDCIQRKIRRAEREQLDYQEGASDELLEKFYRLLTVTRRRHGLPPQPIRWFRALIGAFGSQLKIRTASKNGIAVASILTIAHRRTTVYKYGCSDHTASQYGGTPLIMWRAIQDARAAGHEVFDMGRSDLDNPGLIAFKEHFGAQPSSLHYWMYPAAPWRVRNAGAGRLSHKIISLAPDSVLQMVGRLLYPHIG